MPCRDYESDIHLDPTDSYQYRYLKERADMLARIACKAMNKLEEEGLDSDLCGKDEEVRVWWLAPKVEHNQYFHLPGVGWCFKEQRHAELFMLKWA